NRKARKRRSYQRLETDWRRRPFTHRLDERIDFSGVTFVLRAPSQLDLLPVSKKLTALEVVDRRNASTAEDLDRFFRHRLVSASRINYRRQRTIRHCNRDRNAIIQIALASNVRHGFGTDPQRRRPGEVLNEVNEMTDFADDPAPAFPFVH